MPRRSGFSSGRRAPSRSPPRTTAPPAAAQAAPPRQVAAAPPQAAAAPAAPARGGMMRDIATTAAGVAAGHVAANAIMGMVSGGGSGESAPAPQEQQYQQTQQYQQPQQYQAPASQDPYSGPCGQQLKDFITCTQNNYDISLCTGFNQALKDCKFNNPGS